ncbi:hypothetical protein HJC23_002050 [Cyclotella cryptica]|uniref:DUF6824 domain-containing protein n=1 Tax=Cyclotella cryptica TaxID=29204 RepID=A0ABD3Q684_9STRA
MNTNPSATIPPTTNPRASDVLCGRGGGTNHHIGNNHWRNLVSANKRLYLTLPKRQKALVAKSIVHAIRTQNPPGRFLQKADDELWYDIGDRRACEKTSQALREGAPEIRIEMRDEKTNKMGPVMKPGQILPNGLLALDYEGVEILDDHDKAVISGKDGVISKSADGRDKSGKVGSDVATPQHVVSQGVLSELSMRRAFELFQAGMMPHQQQEKPSKSPSATRPSAIALSATEVPANSLPLESINKMPSSMPPAPFAQSSSAEAAKALERPKSVHPVPQSAAYTEADGRDRVTSDANHHRLSEQLNQQQFALRQSAFTSRSYDPTTLHHNPSIHALVPQTRLHPPHEQSSVSGPLSQQLPNVHHPNSYDIAVDLLMREKLLSARQKAAYAEARLQNLQQIHNLQQHALNASVGMSVAALGFAPASTSSLDQSDSISLRPELLPSMMGRGNSSLSSEELMNLRAARLGTSGGLRHANMTGIGLPSMSLPSNGSIATLAHLRMVELWNHQRRQLAGLTGGDAFAGNADPFIAMPGKREGTGHPQNPDGGTSATVEVERQSSMKYLVKAAGMANETDKNSALLTKSDVGDDDVTLRHDYNLSKKKNPEKTNADWENMKKASRKAAKLTLGKNDQSLTEDSDDDVETIPSSLTKRKRTSNSKKENKHKRKQKKSTSANKLETSQSHSSETQSTLSIDLISQRPQLKRKPPLSPNPEDLIASSKTNHHALSNFKPLDATASTSASLKDIQGQLPLAETTFNRGHSQTLSEVSIERVHSLSDEVLDTSVIGGEGQFDDPEDDD